MRCYLLKEHEVQIVSESMSFVPHEQADIALKMMLVSRTRRSHIFTDDELVASPTHAARDGPELYVWMSRRFYGFHRGKWIKFFNADDVEVIDDDHKIPL